MHNKEQTASQKDVQELMAHAHRLGFTCISTETLKMELANALGVRMTKRVGNNTHQLMACSLPYFPKSLVEAIVPEQYVVKEEKNCKEWTLSSVEALTSVFSPLLIKSTYAFAGLTKAFQSKSEQCIQLLARLIPEVELAHVVDQRTGREKLYINAAYVLATEHGEVHWPKDSEGREIFFCAERVEELRRLILKDVREMGRQGRPLSLAFWRQLGEEGKAVEMERAILASKPRRSDLQAPRSSRRRFTRETFEIDCILDEKRVSSKLQRLYLVRWAGYQPEWEVYRVQGEPGTALETWEPLLLVRNTEALQLWRSTQTHQRRNSC